MVLESLQGKTVNVPVLGTLPIVAVGVIGLTIFLLLRRKKSISLKI